MAVDAAGTGAAGVTNGAIGTGATVFRTGVPTTPGAQVGPIPTQIGAIPLGAGVIHSERVRAQPPDDIDGTERRLGRARWGPGARGQTRARGPLPLANTATLQHRNTSQAGVL
jgi:hypothetical protein